MDKSKAIRIIPNNGYLRINPHQYTIEELEYNIDNLRPTTLYETQTLTADFCAKYLLDPDLENSFMSEDSWFDYRDVLDSQPHITKTELHNACLAFAILKKKNSK